jgi:hypothetical protein
MNMIAQLATEFWLASGARTAERLDALVEFYYSGYYGPAAAWPPQMQDECARAKVEARGRVARFIPKET